MIPSVLRPTGQVLSKDYGVKSCAPARSRPPVPLATCRAGVISEYVQRQLSAGVRQYMKPVL